MANNDSPAPDGGRPSLAELPRELHLEICTFLQVTELLEFGLACKGLQQATNDDALWRAFLRSDFDPPPDQLSVILAAKQAYRRRLEGAISLRERMAERQMTEAQEFTLQASRLKSTAYANAVTITPIALVAPLLIVALALIAGKLDGPLSAWSWWAVLWPLWAAWGAFGLAYLFAMIVEVYRPELLSEMQAGPVSALVRVAVGQGRGRAARYHLAMLLSAVFVLPVTLTLKLQGIGGSDYAWGAAFLPLWVAFFLHAASPWFGSGLVTPGERFQGHVLAWVVILLPALAAFITLAASLDDGFSIPLHRVFIPFWVINGLLLLLGIGLLAHAMVMVCMRRAGRTELFQFFGAFVAFSAILAPPCVFLLLLALKVDAPATATMAWRSVFGPLFFLLAIACVISLIGVPVLVHDGVLRPLRAANMIVHPALPEDPFGAGAASQRQSAGRRNSAGRRGSGATRQRASGRGIAVARPPDSPAPARPAAAGATAHAAGAEEAVMASMGATAPREDGAAANPGSAPSRLNELGQQQA